ncbi:hypothetical protein HPB49_018264 [Dermacentor silvarum]|uniref:Uncharacterized protein n=1 Tax=Dermacentor silvarum TaxID=543639 RepID=A0ACB8CZ68_DERSI|nr:hypothetical protein HPB49_018264 [Dermacentor silvarum]
MNRQRLKLEAQRSRQRFANMLCGAAVVLVIVSLLAIVGASLFSKHADRDLMTTQEPAYNFSSEDEDNEPPDGGYARAMRETTDGDSFRDMVQNDATTTGTFEDSEIVQAPQTSETKERSCVNMEAAGVASEMRHYLFVYGTLKSGEVNHNILCDTNNGRSTLVGQARTLKKWPLVLEVCGEVYQVDDRMLAVLDRLESHPDIYVRSLEDVGLLSQAGGELKAWIYFVRKFERELLSLPYVVNYTGKPGIEWPDYIGDNEQTGRFLDATYTSSQTGTATKQVSTQQQRACPRVCLPEIT